MGMSEPGVVDTIEQADVKYKVGLIMSGMLGNLSLPIGACDTWCNVYPPFLKNPCRLRERPQSPWIELVPAGAAPVHQVQVFVWSWSVCTGYSVMSSRSCQVDHRRRHSF